MNTIINSFFLFLFLYQEQGTNSFIELLLGEVERLPQLHTGRFTGPEGKLQKGKLWEEAATRLNELAAYKTAAQWKQVSLIKVLAYVHPY